MCVCVPCLPVGKWCDFPVPATNDVVLDSVCVFLSVCCFCASSCVVWSHTERSLLFLLFLLGYVAMVLTSENWPPEAGLQCARCWNKWNYIHASFGISYRVCTISGRSSTRPRISPSETDGSTEGRDRWTGMTSRGVSWGQIAVRDMHILIGTWWGESTRVPLAHDEVI